MRNHFGEKKSYFSLRKLAVGVCSVMIGASFLGVRVSADDVSGSEAAPVTLTDTTDTVSEENLGAAAVLAAEDETGSSETTSVEEATIVSDSPIVPDVSIRPKEVVFETWDDLLNWQPGERVDDEVNRASVALTERHQGHLVNATANPEAKVQALSNTNSKAKDHASVGGEEFKSYAFDYWQYLDSMVFWEGMVPSADVIDAGHRNGVPVYGTIFFNWSNSLKDQERFVEALQQDEQGGFPIAKKLVDVAKYYGFDGYFINQETTGRLVRPLGKKMRDFMLYTKEYANSINYPIKYAWYDAMTYEHGRYHEDGLGDYNYNFMESDGKNVPADEFFANFNWSYSNNDKSVETANRIGRSPYDVFAGLELQRGGSYHTSVNWDALFDDKGKLRLSLGLYAPDTITSLGKTGEDYHKHEDIFFTGFQGDPTQAKPEDKQWYGLSNLIADKTPIVGKVFSTSFNTGHGKKWFVDGKVAKDSEWNYRSVSGVLPTWRWWVTSSTDSKLTAGYDFDDAYNGGTSLRFSGDIKENTNQTVNLYSTKLEVTDTTTLRLAHKGGQGSQVYLAVATTPDYKFDNRQHWKALTVGKDWALESFNLADLKGQTIYGIQLVFENGSPVSGYDFHLGHLAISDDQEAPKAPQGLKVEEKRLKNAQEAEAIITFDKADDADYYEVYAQDGDEWRLLTGSSNRAIYLPSLTRQASAKGHTQSLKVVAVGKNGVRSEGSLVDFDWGLDTSDTSLPKALAPNVVLGATVTGSDFNQKEGEGVENMLNGTITSLSDKWSSSQLSGSVYIKLTQPRTIRRWAMDHAGAGGESVNDGLMNTKDFELHYKNADGEWVLAKGIYGNKEHVTDVELDEAITAQEWGLRVITADNGTPWSAIRIYNWRMYEEIDTETPNIPMKHAFARDLGDKHIQVAFKDVPQGTTVYIYDDKAAKIPIASMTADQSGDLVFTPITFTEKPQRLYYKAKTADKDLSNLLVLSLPTTDKTTQSITLDKLPSKKIYGQGESLSLEDGYLRVQFEGQDTPELVALSNSAVTVTGFDAAVLGKQELTVTYLGKTLSTPLSVYVVEESALAEKTLVGLALAKLPEIHYTVGDTLNLDNASLKAVYSDESEVTLSLSSDDVSLSGYDLTTEGRQTVTVTYKTISTTFDILVSPKVTVNDEYLRQRLAEAEALKDKVAVSFASVAAQEVFKEELAKAKEVVANEDKTNDMVANHLTSLTKAMQALDGETHYQAALKQLEEVGMTVESLKGSTKATEMADLLRQAKQHLAVDTLDPLAFSDAIARLQVLIEQAVFVQVPNNAPVAEDKPVFDIARLNHRSNGVTDTVKGVYLTNITEESSTITVSKHSQEQIRPHQLIDQETVTEQAQQTKSENAENQALLPATGDEEHPFFSAAALAIIASVGLAVPFKREEKDL